MAVKAMTVVGLDVHARQTHAAVVDPVTGEVRVSKLRMAPIEVASFLEGLGSDVVAVYEAGPTGFGLARAARERGIDVRVAAPGSIQKGPSDRVNRPPRRDPAGAAAGRRRAELRVRAERRRRALPRPDPRDRGRARRSDARAAPAREVPAAPRRAKPRSRRHGDRQAPGVAARPELRRRLLA